MESDTADRSARLASFSGWLIRERELRGLSRAEVVKTTRLAPAVVDALEAGEPSRLPPRAYVLVFLRAYAGAVGLDPDQVVLRFEEAAGPDAADAGGRRRRGPWLVAALLALAAAGGAAWAWLRLVR